MLYNGADFFIFPSFYEGFVLPMLESMAYGNPMVASNVSSLPEIVSYAGLLVNPYEIDEIVEDMDKLIEDDALQKAFSEKMLKRTQNSPWKKTAELTFKVYHSLC